MKYIIALTLLLTATTQAADVFLTTTNHCTLQDKVTQGTVQALQFCLGQKVAIRKNKKYPIYLVLNSPGGSIYDGLRFIDFAKQIPNLETVTIFAASMAAGIVEALPGTRHVTEEGIIMFHRASGSFRGQFSDGELESRLGMWTKIVHKMEQTNADRMGITLSTYKENVVNEWWLYSHDNVTLRAADRVSTVACSTLLMSKLTTKTVSNIFGEFKISTSACPLMN